MRKLATLSLILTLAAACTPSQPSGSSPLVPAGGNALTRPAAGRTSSATVVLQAGKPGRSIARDIIGANLETWFDVSQPHVARSMAATGIHLTRWPGGSESDTYHWQTNSVCAAGGGYAWNTAQYDNFMKTAVAPAKLDVAITVNYGSNRACNGGGDPHEAAQWVAHTKAHGYPVVAWTVGNEVFGGWEFDLHAKPHDAATYANAVKTGYYPLMKAADARAQIGVVAAGSYSSAWDQTVLRDAKYDYVELHYYPQGPGNESDAYLLYHDPANFAAALAGLRAEIASAGRPASTPIFVGEINSVYSSPGKQSVSIVEALWAGMVVAEMMNGGVTFATWWAAYPGCSTGTNTSSSLYGWQNFGTYNLFSDGPPASQECHSGMAAGTPYPAGRTYALLSKFVGNGATMLPAAVAGDAKNLRAYGDSAGGGYALLLFNLNQNHALPVTVRLQQPSRAKYAATQSTYDKAIYDLTQTHVFKGPVTQNLGTVGGTFAVTLPPWSVNLIELR